MDGFGGGGGIDHGLDEMDIVVTGPDTLAYFFYDGAYWMTGEKYNHYDEVTPVYSGPCKVCDGHNGTFWVALPVPLNPCRIRKIDQSRVSSKTIDLEGIFQDFYCDNADTLWIATSAGLYWTPSNVSLGYYQKPDDNTDFPEELVFCPSYPGPAPTAVVCDTIGRALIVTSGDGLYLYDRNMDAWTHITTADGLNGTDILCVGVDPDNRFYAAGEGWFSYERDIPVGIATVPPAAPLTLHSPYPNPANSFVTIGYTIGQEALVDIALFNALGQKIMDVSMGRVTAGYHRTTFTTNNLASGLYFIRIEADGHHSFAKITFMK